jgi:hypothetical protein
LQLFVGGNRIFHDFRKFWTFLGSSFSSYSVLIPIIDNYWVITQFLPNFSDSHPWLSDVFRLSQALHAMLPSTVPMQWLLKPGVAAPQGPSLQQWLMGLAFEAGIRFYGTGHVGIKNKKTNNGCRMM